jgi:hypothetical protein
VRRVICAALCAAAFAGVTQTAHAAGNGQLAAVWNGQYLLTLNQDGSNQRYIWAAPDGHAGVGEPAWSPDGNRIAFVYDDSSQGPRIAAIDLHTGASTMVSDHEGPNAEGLLRDFTPGWLPDGRIAWRRVPRGTSGGGTLMAAAPDGSGVATLPVALSGDVTGIAWSPAGNVLHNRDGVLITDLAGTTLDSLPLGRLSDFAWSPDESWIVRSRGRDPSQLQLVDLYDGSAYDLTSLVPGQGDSTPAWSPDGTTIVYAHSEPAAYGFKRELRALDLESGAQRRIADANGLSGIAWQPCVAVTASCSSPPPPKCWPDGMKVAWPTPAPCSLPVGPVPNPVGPSAPRPASAPSLLVRNTPKLDRRGRALISGRCTRSCKVSLRLSTRLNTGRVLRGAVATASTTKPLGAGLAAPQAREGPAAPAHRRRPHRRHRHGPGRPVAGVQPEAALTTRSSSASICAGSMSGFTSVSLSTTASRTRVRPRTASPDANSARWTRVLSSSSPRRRKQTITVEGSATSSSCGRARTAAAPCSASPTQRSTSSASRRRPVARSAISTFSASKRRDVSSERPTRLSCPSASSSGRLR